MPKKDYDFVDKKINDLLPAGFYWGYVGDVEDWGDDRVWSVFHDGPDGPVPLGHALTKDRAKLLPIAKAAALAANPGG